MNVQMRHRFARVRAVVDDEAEALLQVEFLGHLSGDQQEVPEDSLIRGGRFADPWYHLFGDDEQMHRRLGLDVVQNDAVFVFMLQAGRDFARDDFFEEGRHMK